MSANELRAKVQGISTDLLVGKSSVISALFIVDKSLTALRSIDSNALDVAIALQGLMKVQHDLKISIADMDRTQQDVDNYRWSL
jgi:hypothetical protein